MHFDQRDEGDFTIYAQAIETSEGDYTAAAVVMQVRGVDEAVEVFRDLNMSGGYAWDDPDRALHFAIHVATEVLRERTQLSAAALLLKAA